MANPDFSSFSNEQDGTGAITVNSPAAHAAGNKLVLYIANDGNFVPSLSTANGYVLAVDPQGNAASVNIAGQCGMHVFWKTAVGANTTTDPPPVIAAPTGGGTVQCCHQNVYVNCRAGNPFHKITTATLTSPNTVINPPSITTGLAGCTVFSVAASAEDDTRFENWTSTGSASPGGSIDSGWHSGLGNKCSWAGGRGGFAAAGGPHNCTANFDTSTQQAQITFALASLPESGASGSANVGGITSSGTAIPGTFATGTANVGGITSTGSATSPGAATGSANVGGITSTGVALTPAIASGSANVGGITSAGSVGVSPWGMIGESTAGQRADQTGPTTGTMSTAFANRAPSTAYPVNDRLVSGGRRYHVRNPGTTSAGAGPSGTGVQADGTASLVALQSTDTALTMTTQTSNSVMLVVMMRENWSSDTSAPTDSKGNTYTLQGSAHFYADFPSAAAALFAKTNAVGGGGHTVSATWPVKGSTGAEMTTLVVEVPTGRSSSFIQAVSHVERAGGPATLTSASVTTTGPAMLVAALLGTGGVIANGTSHVGTPIAPFVALPNAGALIAIHENGYVQGQLAYAFVTLPGTYTASWTTTEGAQMFLVAIQELPGTSASGSANVGGISSTGLTGPAASGSANVGGVTSTGVAGSSAAAAEASGSANVGGITGSGSSAVASSGSANVGGITGTGTAIAGTLALGSSTVGGIASTGIAATPGTSSGSSSVGGIASTGTAITGTFAGGTATVGGILVGGAAGSGLAAVRLAATVTATAGYPLTVEATAQDLLIVEATTA